MSLILHRAFLVGYGKMAIDILQRYYNAELLWMKFIGASCLTKRRLSPPDRFIATLSPTAPLYAALAIYLTWEDHGRPDLRDIL